MADEKEIQKLARRYGEPERAAFQHRIITSGFGDWVRRLTRRRGEVILVVPRGQAHVLLHTKSHYPASVYRLPTGGIRNDEAADDAARREALEELGWKPRGLELIGVLDNTFVGAGTELSYPSFVFKTEVFLDKPNPANSDEAISGFREANAAAMEAIALQLARLPNGWFEWGRFRAASHHWLVERM